MAATSNIGLANIAKEADELVLWGRLGLNVVPVVVAVVAWELLAAASWALSALWVHELDVVGVVWSDDGGDVEIVQASPSIPADLTEHAVAIRLLVVADADPVANPAPRKLGDNGLARLEADVWELWRALLRSEPDGTTNVVAGDHVDCVLCSHGCDESCKRQSLEELHCGGLDGQKMNVRKE